MRLRYENSFSGTVDSSGEVIGDAIGLHGHEVNVSFEVYNSGAQALSDFVLQVLVQKDAAWVDFLSGSEWAATDIAAKKFVSSTLPDTLAGGSKSQAVVRLEGVQSVRFKGITASSSTTVAVRVLVSEPQSAGCC